MGIICTDAGHGGSDSGAAWNNVLEKDLNIIFTRQVNEALKQRGHTVFTTRNTDFTFPLGTRCRLVNSHHRENAPTFDAIVSIHCNVAAIKDEATGGYKALPSRKGFYAIYAQESTDGTNLSQAIADSVRNANIELKHNGMLSTAELNRRLAWIHKTLPPATLLELGFMTNPEDLQNLQDAAYQKKMVKAIIAGIENFIK